MSDKFLSRIADALERISPPDTLTMDFTKGSAFLWNVRPNRFKVVDDINSLDLDLLLGIDRAREILLQNTYQFAKGFPANNALLWGARGMGKSSLVKSIFNKVQSSGLSVKLVEIHREDLPSISQLLAYTKGHSERFILFCDDLSFSIDDEHYKSLKTVLDGGIEGRPENVIFYATSNRRHLMPRDMIENEAGSAINPSEAVEEKVSLSDRFGLWLGFHPCSQEEFLLMIEGYCKKYGLHIDQDLMISEAIEWQQTRGGRSGRVAWQYFIDLAGRLEINI
ncbi:MAG: ATP-binding protein [Paracoccaceae bacterium]